MNQPRHSEPKKSGYPESEPRRKDGSERHPPSEAPHQPQNTPDEKPTPSSG